MQNTVGDGIGRDSLEDQPSGTIICVPLWRQVVCTTNGLALSAGSGKRRTDVYFRKLQQAGLTNLDGTPILKKVAGVQDDFVAGRQPFCHFAIVIVHMADFDRLDPGGSVNDFENRPIAVRTEKGADRHLKHIVA